MSASQVHAVIAAGLEDPTLLERWRREPDLLRKCGVDPASFDLDAIWKFAGLSTKVRHNGLRADLPLTFRLLNVAGLEIDVFASYAAHCAAEGKVYAATSDARSQDLLLFLEQWLDFDKHEHALLWDLMRHELALSRLGTVSRRTDFPVCPGQAGMPVLRAASVPRLCGDIVLHEMRSDPRITGALLQQKNPNLNEVVLGEFYFCYWRGAAEELFILEFDELGFYLLAMVNGVDGARSAADLAHLISGRRRPSPALLGALSQLAAIGIIAFD